MATLVDAQRGALCVKRLAFFLGYRACSSSAISRFRMATFLRSSRAMPWLSGGDRRRSMTLASSSRFFASVFWASVSSGLRGPSKIFRLGLSYKFGEAYTPRNSWRLTAQGAADSWSISFALRHAHLVDFVAQSADQ